MLNCAICKKNLIDENGNMIYPPRVVNDIRVCDDCVDKVEVKAPAKKAEEKIEKEPEVEKKATTKKVVSKKK